MFTLIAGTFLASLGQPAPAHAAGGPNLAIGKSVSASGYADVYIESNVTDGNSGTYWESVNQAFPQWVQVDLGSSAVSVDQVVLKLPAGWESRTQTLSVQGSADGNNFSNLKASEGYTFDPNTGNTVTLDFPATPVRYVRIHVTANTAWPAAQLSELEVYGSASQTDPHLIPGKIEAESYSTMSGIQTEATTDTGGGLNVGWIDAGDWLDYSVNIQSAGTYTVEYRVAGNTTTGRIELQSGGTTLATTEVPDTGGWQNWQTVSATVQLEAGQQTLRVFASGAGFNLNWLQFTPGSTSDNQAPTAPAGLTFTQPDSGKILLTWNPSTDNVGVSGYDIYANNQLRGSVSGSTLTYTDTQPVSLTVTYYVVAKDSAGNVSEPSNTVTRNGTSTNESNLAIGKQISASSSTFTYVAANANDNDVKTYWEGSGHPSTLTIDLGANTNVTSVVLKLNPDSQWTTRTQTIQVLGHPQTSTTFTNLVAATSYTFNPALQNTVTIPVNATMSKLQLQITANSGAPGGQIAEFQILGSPAPNPDLTVTDITWLPVSPDESQSVMLNATVQNIGDVASPATNVNFYLGTVLAGSANVGALQPGASANVSADIGAKEAGSYTVTAKVDENDTVIEANNANNSRTSTSNLVIGQVQSSDLIGTLSWTPGNPSAGDTVTFTVNLKNQGTVASNSGSHGIKVELKNPSGVTVKTLAGSYNGSLAAGESTNVTVGTWTAVNGSYTLSTTVEADANEAPVKHANNVSVSSLYSGRGANMPFTILEAESSANSTNGTKLAPNFTPGDFAGEASNRSAIYLDATGEYVEFTLTSPANAFVLRNAVAENTTGTVSIYADGVDKGNFTVTSKFSYVYATPSTLGRLGYDNTGSKAYWLYEDAQLMLDKVYPAGTKIKIQKDAGDVPWIYVDMIETENVAPPASNPDPSKYVQVSATKSIEQALNEFRQDSSKKGIFIPAGEWTISSKIYLYGRATEIIGAGPWHTKLVAPQDQTNTDVGFNISSAANGSTIKNLSAWGNYIYRQDGPGKFIDGNGMQNVTIENIWAEHFICLYWGVNSSHNTFKNNRIKNVFADGINMTNGSSYNIIDNNYARGTGDDSFALFSAIDAGGSYNVGNKYTNLTATNVRRAAAFAIYGGENNLFQNLYGADTLTYPGLTISSLSFGYNTLGFGNQDTVIDGVTLDRTGGDFWTSVGADDKINDYQNFGAVWFHGGDRDFKNILVKNVDINNPVYFGLMFQSKSPENLPMQNIRLENITINSPTRYGIKLVAKAEDGQGPVVGAASFTNVKVNNPGVTAIYGENKSPGFNVIRVSDNNW